MFLSYNQVRTILICDLCKNNLSDPRLVPCGRSFCNKCIARKSSNSVKFNCPCEENFHFVPGRGFPKNSAIEFLLNQRPSEVSRGETAEELKSYLNKMHAEVNDIEKSMNLVESKVAERCCSIRNEIDLSTEIAIQDIQNQRDELIKKVNEYEKECRENLKDENDLKTELDKSIRETREFYKKWQIKFEEYRIHENEFKQGLTQCSTFQNRINKNKHTLDKFTHNGGELVSFKPNEKKDLSIGSFETAKFFNNFKNRSSIDLKDLDIEDNEHIDFKIFENYKIVICSSNDQTATLQIYDTILNVVENSNEICFNEDDEYYIYLMKCFILNDNNILVCISFINGETDEPEHTKLHVCKAVNLKVSYMRTIYVNMVDIDINSKFIYSLIKTNHDSQTVVRKYSKYLTCDSDDILISSFYDIQSETTDLKVNEDYLFLIDQSRKIAMIDIETELLIREFKIDGALLSLHNEIYILSFNSSMQVVNYYDFYGKIIGNEAIYEKIDINLIKGDNNRILFYDCRSNKIHF